MGNIEQFIRHIPKAELHCHIEGTLEPELMVSLAKRNHITLPFATTQEVRQAYEFSNLQSFLDIYYQSANVLQTEQDFFDLTWAYLNRAKKDNICHCEIFFDPQTHTVRDISFATVINGIQRALDEGEKKLAISSKLILCFLRDLSEKEAIETLNQALPFKEWIVAVGLDSAEIGNPPSKFQKVFQMARDAGFLCVAHAGEEGPSEYIWQALQLLQVKRIDHGIRCKDDEALMTLLKEKQIPLTVCPLSNVKLKVFNTLDQHVIKTLLHKGLCVTINSDDPAFFGGYVVDNYLSCCAALNFSKADIVQLAKNSFSASFLDDAKKSYYIDLINKYAKNEID